MRNLARYLRDDSHPDGVPVEQCVGDLRAGLPPVIEGRERVNQPLHLYLMGRFEEAEGELRRALGIDPLFLIINAALAVHHYTARQYDRAIDQCRKTLELEPNFGLAHWFLGRAYAAQGQFDDAIAELQRALPLTSNSGEVAGDLDTRMRWQA